MTHDQEEALELANQVVVMHEGKVEQAGAPADVYNDPATAFVAGFVGAANVLHGHVVDGKVHLGTFQVPGADHLEEGRRRRLRAAPRRPGVREDTGVRGTIERRRRWVGSRGSRSRSPAARRSSRTCPTTSSVGPRRATRSGSISAARRRSASSRGWRLPPKSIRRPRIVAGRSLPSRVLGGQRRGSGGVRASRAACSRLRDPPRSGVWSRDRTALSSCGASREVDGTCLNPSSGPGGTFGS